MSLEEAILAQANATMALAKAIERQAQGADHAVPPSEKPASGKSQAAERQAPKPSSTPTPTPSEASTNTSAAATADAKTQTTAGTGDKAAPSYDDVAAAFIAAVKRNKGAAVAVVSSFGVARCPELKPEQWAEFIEKIGAVKEAS